MNLLGFKNDIGQIFGDKTEKKNQELRVKKNITKEKSDSLSNIPISLVSFSVAVL